MKEFRFDITKDNYKDVGDSLLINTRLECLLECLYDNWYLKADKFKDEPLIKLFHGDNYAGAIFYNKFDFGDLLVEFDGMIDGDSLIDALDNAYILHDEKYGYLNEADELGLI